MFYLDNRTKYKFTQYDGHHPDAQVMDDKKMLHLAKSSTVSVRFQPEILNGNLSILYVVSPFTIIINYSKLSSIHSQLSSIHSQLSSIIHNYHQLFTIIINLSQLSSIINNYHRFIHPQSSSTLQFSRLYVVSRTFTIIFMKRQCLRQFTIIFMRRQCSQCYEGAF